jgi:hypothetical protein
MEDGEEGAVSDVGGDGLDIGGEGAIVGDFGGDGADCGDCFFCESAGLQRGEELDALRGAEKFDGDDVTEILEHAAEAACAAHAFIGEALDRDFHANIREVGNSADTLIYVSFLSRASGMESFFRFSQIIRTGRARRSNRLGGRTIYEAERKRRAMNRVFTARREI